jgi:hypothetical protein
MFEPSPDPGTLSLTEVVPGTEGLARPCPPLARRGPWHVGLI